MNDLPTEQSAEGSSIIAVNSQGEAVKIPSSAVGGGSSVTVVDNLNSNSSTSALSARQGKALNTRVTALENGGGGGGAITTDATPTQGSTNPVQSGGVYSALQSKADATHTHAANQVSGLAEVATSGSYEDLQNKPTIADTETVNVLLNSSAMANNIITADVSLPLRGYISQATHQFVDTTGDDRFECSGFVYVRGFKQIEFSARSYSEAGDSCQMCFYDSSRNVIPALDICINDGITQTIDLTSSTYANVYYIVMSAYLPGWSSGKTYLRVSGDYDFANFLKKTDIKEKTGYNLFNVNGIERGMGITSSGSYIKDTQSITSNLIELPEDRGRNGDLFLFNLPATTYSKRFIYYDEDMNVVAGPSDIAATDTSAQIGCRSDAKYFRFTLIRATSPLPSEEDVAEMFANTVVTFQYSMTDPQPYYKNIESINGVGLCASNISNLYKGKKWVCVGDSLTERNSHSTKFYHDFIKEWLGFTVVNMGVSGTGYKTRDDVQSPTTEGAFYQRVTQIPTDADVVTIFGSFNDMTQSHTLGTPADTGTTTICGCINATIEAIYTINPAIKLGIIAPCPWKEMNPTNQNAVAYVEALETICKNNSIPFLNLFYESGLRPWERAVRDLVYDLDAQTGGDYHGTHPNAIGHEMIASKMKVFIQSLI